MYYVIGSGPTGISCAQALVASGKEVTILDSGQQLEPHRQQAVRDLAASDSSQWDAKATAFLRDGVSTGKGGIPLKLLFGSDFPYREIPGATQIVRNLIDVKPSYALGGFSTVWGGAVMPYRQSDIADWPIGVADLENAYRAILTWMPLSARNDDLAEYFPLYREHPFALPLSRQAEAILSDLARNRQSLNARGIYFGSSRLAVETAKAAPQTGCVLCGLCMYGCPHRLIYSSDQSLPSLLQTGLVQYRGGVAVRSVEETGSGVIVQATDSNGSRLNLNGERAFLACGPLNTTAILLRSLDAYHVQTPIQDSQYFLLPILRFHGAGRVCRERLHTMAQIFIDIFDEAISPYTIHLQLYTYNDLFRDRALNTLGPLRRLFPLETFLGHLMLLQGYLHSKHSSSLIATLEKNGGGDHLRLEPRVNPETKTRIARVINKLARISGKTGFIPLPPLLEVGAPGRGFHSGGSFPMTAQASPGKSDLLGRPYGLKRVHAVDSTVFPSIPATTITLTAMANAYRIGSLAAKEE